MTLEEEVAMSAQRNSDSVPAASSSSWQSARLLVTDEFAAPPVILRVGDSVIGTLGNFSASTGKAKSKKTFNVCVDRGGSHDGRHGVELFGLFAAVCNAVSDIVASAEIPENIRLDIALYAGCVAGASMISEIEKCLAVLALKES